MFVIRRSHGKTTMMDCHYGDCQNKSTEPIRIWIQSDDDGEELFFWACARKIVYRDSGGRGAFQKCCIFEKLHFSKSCTIRKRIVNQIEFLSILWLIIQKNKRKHVKARERRLRPPGVSDLISDLKSSLFSSVWRFWRRRIFLHLHSDGSPSDGGLNKWRRFAWWIIHQPVCIYCACFAFFLASLSQKGETTSTSGRARFRSAAIKNPPPPL